MGHFYSFLNLKKTVPLAESRSTLTRFVTLRANFTNANLGPLKAALKTKQRNRKTHLFFPLGHALDKDLKTLIRVGGRLPIMTFALFHSRKDLGS
jgi:hypothetical protein